MTFLEQLREPTSLTAVQLVKVDKELGLTVRRLSAYWVYQIQIDVIH